MVIMTAEELAFEIRKLLLTADNISETQAAKLINMSQQNFSKKLRSGTLRYVEVVALLDALGYKAEWLPKE